MKARIWIFLFFLTLSCYSFAQKAQKGFLDLSKHNFDREGKALLVGEWEFYWNELLTPGDFSQQRAAEWISIPKSWHRLGHPVTGYGTYRLHVRLDSTQHGLSLYFPIINSSAKVWVNGILRAETGSVNTDPYSYNPMLRATVVSIPEKTRDLEIIVQAANFVYFNAGIMWSPEIDKNSTLYALALTTNGIENFFAGSLFAMFIYQLILYFLYHRGKPYLWLALICLGVSLRAMIVHGGSFLLPNLFPEVHWEIWKKLEFGSVYAIGALFPLYVYHLFTEHAPRKPMWFFVVTSGLLCTAVIVTPQYLYGRLLDVSHVELLLAFIYAVYSISRAWRSGNQDARIILFGVLASFPFILTEILKNSLFHPFNIQFMYLVELGVLVFLLFQVYLLANHYAKSYKNLEMLNQDLERIVTDRTEQLVKANTVKDRLLSVMSHDIKSPLNSLRGVLQIYNKGAITKEEFDHFSQVLEGDLGKTSMLVENILFWTASQVKGVQVIKEKFDLAVLVDENVQLFKTIATNKRIRLKYELPEGLKVEFDRNILNLVLRNLISNAIKFSHEGGEVSIKAMTKRNSVLIQVSDQGVGMDENAIQNLMNPKTVVSTAGTTQEKGTGLGLSLSREFLQKAGGVLSVESLKGKGTTFNVVIPS